MSVSTLKKILALLALAIVSVCVLYYFIYNFLEEKDSTISQLKNELEIQTKNKDYIFSIKNIIADNGNDIDHIKQSILPQDQDASFIERIEALGRTNAVSVEIDSLVYDDDQILADKGLLILRVKMRTRGTWVQTYRFIAELEGLPYRIKVDRIALSRMVDGGDVRKLTPSNIFWQGLIDIEVLKYK